MSFSADDAIEIASTSADAENFEKKYPDCVWNVEKMKPRDAEKWIKDHPKAAVAATAGKAVPKVLWIVEIEELDQEKLILVVSPDTKKIVDTRTEKLAPAEEDDEEEEDEGVEEEE